MKLSEQQIIRYLISVLILIGNPPLTLHCARSGSGTTHDFITIQNHELYVPRSESIHVKSIFRNSFFVGKAGKAHVKDERNVL